MRIVFTPGFMQPASAWEAVAGQLGERYSSVLVDHREHTFEGRVGELAEAGQGAVLCGYSLGGRLALHTVLRDPGAYAGLVMVGTSAGIEEPVTRAERARTDEKLASWMETQPIESIVDIWERQPLFADQSDSLVEAQKPGRLAQDPRSLALILRTAGQGVLEPVWGRLSSLDVPVLALAGDRDQRYSGGRPADRAGGAGRARGDHRARRARAPAPAARRRRQGASGLPRPALRPARRLTRPGPGPARGARP